VTSELTEFELKVFQSAWFALKDITSPEFMKTFRPIWSRNANEIETFSQKCGYPINLSTTNVALTLKPNKTIEYTPENDTYLINLWYFLFGEDNGSVIIKPSIYLVGDFIHEHNHQDFCRNKNMVCKSEKITSQFLKDYHAEMEKRAILQEIKCLKKALNMAKKQIQIREFQVESWTEKGIPTCHITNDSICPDAELEKNIMNCNSVRKKLTALTQDDFNKTIETEMISWYGQISKVLNLSEPSLASPIAKWFNES
jgi:hypothetical protein